MEADNAPTVEQYNSYKERFNNWGRWGQDDQLGTLNHITPEVRATRGGAGAKRPDGFACPPDRH